MNQDLAHWAAPKIAQIELALDDLLPPVQADTAHLVEAMRYSILDGGKRIRPLLMFSVAELFKIPLESVIKPACSLELIHGYSLIHDDLPAMDDDDLRRGKPSCHKKFGEATAILAGDALLTLAFENLANLNLSADIKICLIQILSQASGANGMVLGQSLDIQAENKTINFQQLKTIHRNKTGALINAALLMGACIGQAATQETRLIEDIGQQLGLAFQIQDDILDVTMSSQTLGKPAGSDNKIHKNTYVSLLGLDKAKEQAKLSYQQILNNLTNLNYPTDKILALSEFIIHRNN